MNQTSPKENLREDHCMSNVQRRWYEHLQQKTKTCLRDHNNAQREVTKLRKHEYNIGEVG